MAKILVVDDDYSVAGPLIDYLRYRGNSVEYADNGKRGLELISLHFPDFIILDVEMPVLNGPKMAYRLLVEDCGRENIPILLVSGIANLRVIAEAIVRTPYFVGKPFTLEEIDRSIEKLMRERLPPHPRDT
ncbi:MAG: hypothetical protein C5B49_03460 [Bdellovibrio sp.]|nr:MAG: hypothetical protein C5B49_03460 [Bdellovibrio sp.]